MSSGRHISNIVIGKYSYIVEWFVMQQLDIYIQLHKSSMNTCVNFYFQLLFVSSLKVSNSTQHKCIYIQYERRTIRMRTFLLQKSILELLITSPNNIIISFPTQLLFFFLLFFQRWSNCIAHFATLLFSLSFVFNFRSLRAS